MAINEDNELYAWGWNNNGQVGDGTSGSNANKTGPVKICITTANCPTNWVKVAAGHEHSLAINTAGELYAWGYNQFGQVGDGTNTNKNRPPKICITTSCATSWNKIAGGIHHSLAINAAGILYAWGRNDFGQVVGDGTNTNKNRPGIVCITIVNCPTNWNKIASGIHHSLAINAAGELYAWGYNAQGQLGDGANTNKNRPIKIGASTNWVSIAVGATHSLAINQAGELYAWGDNGLGQLGDGDGGRVNARSSIVSIP